MAAEKKYMANGSLFNNDAWTKKVGVIDGNLNFWEGNYNCYILVKNGLDLQNFFSEYTNPKELKIVGDRISGKTVPEVLSIFTIPKIKVYNFLSSWTTLHLKNKQPNYVNLSFTFAHQDKGERPKESFNLNIHLLINNGGKNHKDFVELDDNSKLIETINQKLEFFTKKFSNGEIKQNFDQIKQYKYNGMTFNCDTSVYVPANQSITQNISLAVTLPINAPNTPAPSPKKTWANIAAAPPTQSLGNNVKVATNQPSGNQRKSAPPPQHKRLYNKSAENQESSTKNPNLFFDRRIDNAKEDPHTPSTNLGGGMGRGKK